MNTSDACMNTTDTCMDKTGLLHWGLTPQQQPGSYRGGDDDDDDVDDDEMSVSLVEEARAPRETTNVRQATDISHIRPVPVPESNLGRSGVKPGDLRNQESNAVAH